MKLYYVANARMPSEKAHGIQIAKMCEAFIEDGVDVCLVVPSRAREAQSIQEFYQLRVAVPSIRLTVPDFYTRGRFGYRVSSYIFMAASAVFLRWKKIKGERFTVYTVDLDNFSSSALPLAGAPLYSEMHGGKPSTCAQRFLFRHVRGIISINSIIVEELKNTFKSSSPRYCVEPNGVDAAAFHRVDKKEARKRLGLPLEENIVMYVGRFFDWKGLEILPRAAALSPMLRWQTVGGSEAHFKEFVREPLPPNFHFADSRPHEEMPLWLSAADALIVLGTKRDAQSYLYTSPMKLFEYLLSGRPIVASNTPAIRQIVSEKEVLFYEPDDAKDLADTVAHAVAHSGKMTERIETAGHKGKTMSWSGRARRIKQFMHE
ncbi:MAG: glycosyltransferase [Patescibacteria group bacterium]|mgnify:FL=1